MSLPLGATKAKRVLDAINSTGRGKGKRGPRQEPMTSGEYVEEGGMYCTYNTIGVCCQAWQHASARAMFRLTSTVALDVVFSAFFLFFCVYFCVGRSYQVGGFDGEGCGFQKAAWGWGPKGEGLWVHMWGGKCHE